MRAVRQSNWIDGPSRELRRANQMHVDDLRRSHEPGHGEIRIRDEEVVGGQEDRRLAAALARYLPRSPLP
jgi:hypothetical protein